MKRPLNIRIVRGQTSVCLLYYARIVAQPDRDFVETDAAADQQAGEGVPHQMWREFSLSNPFQPERLGVFNKRPREIVSVSVPAVFHFRPEHVRFPQSVAAQKTLKLLREWDCPFLAILEFNRRRRAQVQQTGAQIKPPWSRLNDLVLSQASMEAAEQDKTEIFALALFDKSITFCFRTEVLESSSSEIRNDKIDVVTRVTPADVGDVHSPSKKRVEDHVITVRSLDAAIISFLVVERLNLFCSDEAGRHLYPVGERAENVETAVRAGGCELVLPPLVSKKPLDFLEERSARAKVRSNPNLPCAFNCLRVIVCLQADELAHAVLLEIQPVNVATPVDPNAISRSRHAADCNTSTVTPCKRIIRNIPVILPF